MKMPRHFPHAIDPGWQAQPAHALICKKTFAFSFYYVLIHELYKKILFRCNISNAGKHTNWGQDMGRHTAGPCVIDLQPSAEIQNMMRKMILLCAALSLWAAGNTHAAGTPPIQLAAYQAAPAALAMRLASLQSPEASPRAPAPYEPSTPSLLLVAIVLLSLRMRVRASSEKFSA
jgi:hypothetical protein